MSVVVVITGASAGVGRAMAVGFAQKGYDVGLIARGRAGLDGAGRDVEASGRRALVLPLDVADADAVMQPAIAFARPEPTLALRFRPCRAIVAGWREEGAAGQQIRSTRRLSDRTHFRVRAPNARRARRASGSGCEGREKGSQYERRGPRTRKPCR